MVHGVKSVFSRFYWLATTGRWGIHGVFDDLYAGQPRSETFRNIYRDVFAEEFAEEADASGFLTMSDLKNISRDLALHSGQSFVDLACGRGGASLWISREMGADVLGIDISSVAIADAERRIASFGRQGHARFAVGDIAATNIPSGTFDGAMSEGIADFLAASITGDHGMGRGFFYNESALRDLDEDGREHVFPDDVGEIHFTGIIIGGAFWDLRTAFIDELGEGPGIALTNHLYFAALQRATSIPTCLVEVLAADDDDGDLANGTPHECEIRAAFGRHGLRTVTGTADSPSAFAQVDQQGTVGITLHVDGLSAQCTGDEIARVVVDWSPGAGSPIPSGNVQAAVGSGDAWTAQLPVPYAGTDLLYRATIEFTDGTTLHLPDNPGDTNYVLYQGTTVPLYCTSFDDVDPFGPIAGQPGGPSGTATGGGWTHGTIDGAAASWAWGTPAGGATDPTTAYSGDKIVALGLGTDYEDQSSSFAQLPTLDVGDYTDVRLQYRRWLAVEDGHFDQAQITANGARAWMNLDSNMGDSSSTHTIDREWRFQDVPLSQFIQGSSLDVAFSLTSDQGLHFGGWALDDVCVVANPLAVCGDGVKAGREDCDDGVDNGDVADACRIDCRKPVCGDSIIDGTEDCDDGPGGSSTCSAECQVDATSGCQTGSSSGDGAGLLAALGLIVLRRRRR